MRTFGWVLAIWGALGLFANLIALVDGTVPLILLGTNSLVCGLFIYFGRRLILRNPVVKSAEQLKEEEEKKEYW